MQWIMENWLILLFAAGTVGMHLFGHRHGGKGGHDHGSQDYSSKQGEKKKDQTDEATDT